MAALALSRFVPAAPQALCALLDGNRGPVAPPIRAEIFGAQRFAQHGRSLGQTHRAGAARARAATFFPRLRDNIRVLREAHRYIGTQASTGYDISPAAEWLLDNFHLIEAQLKEIHEGLPRSYFRKLPMLIDEPLAGLPRIYGVAWAFVAHTDGAFDEALLMQFLGAYQETRELDLAEMWALPTVLRVVLIENLRRVAERVATNKAAREVANLCSDRIDSFDVASLDAVRGLLDQRGAGRMFLAQLRHRLQGSANAHADDDAALQGLRAWLPQAMPDMAEVQTQQSADQAADNLTVSNALNSLRAIGDADWPDIVARTSTLMRLMLTSPLFEAEHPQTRDQTLHGIERWARRSGLGELEVARKLLEHMHAGGAAVASHWLEGPGRRALAQSLGLGGRAARSWRPVVRRLVLPLYLGSLLLGTLGLVAWMLMHAPAAAAPTGLAALLMLLPASEALVAVINRLIGESVRPQVLPRLALRSGIPAEHRVMVVIPAMLTHAASARTLAHRLHLHYLANPERQAQFALLTDWADADSAGAPTDDTLLADAVREIEALNARHPAETADAAPRFIVLHRTRRFSASEQRWIGWERKRGKLEQLVALLAGGEAGDFIALGEASRIAAATRYIVTLDSDTHLPPGTLRALVGVAAHPHNQPVLDRDRHAIVGGHAILQPRLVTPLPSPRELSLFHRLFAGQCGIDPYSVASSEVYQDLFDAGSFSGKGLLHVHAVHAVLAGRLPEGLVLSHDLLEGAIARCAAVTDVAFIEDAPFHADVALWRAHRWMRGDWQLLPILFRPWRWRLRLIDRWKMADNLRRSLVAPASLALLLLALATEAIAPSAALLLVLAAFTAGPLLGALAGFAPSRDDIAKRHFYRQAAADLARAVAGGLWHLAQLLQQALMAVDAIARALFRMTISRRRLLQWTPADALQAAAQGSLASTVRRHWSLPPVALLLLGGLLAAGTRHPALAATLCALWAASPLWTWGASRRRGREVALPVVDRAYLEGIARSTWRFFERCIGADDHHLPPDNLQSLPHEMLAHRTSPTNIGLYLLSAACARAFGWIDTAQLLARLEATLATLAKLQRHRGHLLNWYDTQTLAPLLPMYVSTVDSGNLCGHLLAVGQACRELEATPPVDDETRRRLLAVAAECEHLAWAPEFGFLYHRKRHLFHIGYRVAEQELDAGFYDLLASESRLTSLLAVAKGDVPVSHWAALGRPFFAVGARAGLRSWSGSMFEYLMPSLVLDEPPGSVLRDACCAALGEQVAFARAHGVPWGISESAYAGRDHTLAYQYAPQGVPRLALRRTPPDELVVAPYATALAAQIEPHAACMNFAALQSLGARGEFGFIEALDFTPSRQTETTPRTPVATSMSHHQGMTIVALANVLLDGAARRWGMADPHIEAVASLLHERAPREISLLYAPPSGPPPQAQQRRAPGLLREVLPGGAALQPTHMLGNGRYSVTLRANGAGTSRWGPSGINRSRDDALRDAHGSFFWVRWDRQTQPVSITQHPAPDAAAHYQSLFHADRVCFDAAWPELQAHATVWVSPEDDIEFRRIELRNLGERTLDIELLSAFEVTLADPRADEAHPAFSNLFVRAAWRADEQALLFERKPRLATERSLHAAHFLADGDPQVVGVRVQADRARWLGRNRPPSQPLAAFDALPDEASAERNDAGDVVLPTGLDPVCAMAVRLRIAPHAKAELTFATAASDSASVLSAVIDKYRQPINVQRASMMSATLSGIRLRALGISAENFAAIQSLTTALVQTITRPVAPTASDAAPTGACDRRLLWRFGISGDRPILLVAAGATQGRVLLRALAQALRLWSWGGVACDLVVVNAEAASYHMALHREIAALREQHGVDEHGHPGRASCTGLHLLRADELSADELATLQSLARVRLSADGRPLPHRVQEWCELHEQAFESRHDTSTAAVGDAARAAAFGAAAPEASVGNFAPRGGAFSFIVGAERRPARPWINVLANPGFGAQLSEAGGGYTWAHNSRLNQLTAWSNDPLADPPSEWFVLQDRRTREAWSVTPSAWGMRTDHRVEHGQGHSVVRHRRGEVEISASWCVDADSAVKQVRLQIANHGPRTLHWRAVGIAEWLMGAQRSDRGTVHTALHRQRLPEGKLTALLCTQRERSAGFGGGTAFLATAASGPGADSAGEDWTCDRRECFDARGGLVLPDHFGQRAGAGLDPCAALAVALTVAPGDTAEQVFLIGHADSADAARQLAAQACAASAATRSQRVAAHWDGLLGACTVQTPDALFDALVNRWLLYQTIACRLWAKAGFYQAGGATGFRDQLQDALALAWAAPSMLRDQIVLAASRQFVEGDVQHWWHSPGGAGVRTHFSDDLLWLPHACVHYLRATGDAALLDQRVPFLDGAPIADGAEDAYDTPAVSAEQASVYEHAARAIDRSLRVGVHGLPLMGSGDWNDGMNRVGIEGRGESVWLGWFLCHLVADFAPLARTRGEPARAERWEDAARGWALALNGPAWDGQWFKRAFFDDGSPLGSRVNAEGRIDLIAQAWSVLSGVAPGALQRIALAAVEEHLVDRDAGLIRLLDPPLADAVPSAGYIQAYPPGVRENGGQYSHAGVWALMAQAEYARAHPGATDGGDIAYRYFTYLSPAHRAQHATRGPAYGLEPYVMAGDVYSQPPHVGRGGWSWYTGAAAWMHRAAIESIFGLRLAHDTLCLCPVLPSHWPRAELTLRRDGRSMRFILLRQSTADALATTADLHARLLPVGRAIAWRDLASPSCFVIPLPASPA
ncbi:MAG TPA: glucoamylase family protein [Burkholderiaceae bacterium]|nr:glucoamylase family protein [Burkholderiaceae bacterium]